MTLEILTSDNLVPCRHGFFTRHGGASSGIFAGLNCGLGSSDQSEIVSINRMRVADAMHTDVLFSVHQIHSSDVVTITGNIMTTPSRADAMVSNQTDVVLSVLTADCQPVLFADHKAGVIGAAHAGWRGALNGILENTVSAMCDLGATTENIHAVIGPCISQSAYEVGPEFVDAFVSVDPLFERFFAHSQSDRRLFDLPGFSLHLLQRNGISAEWTGQCTFSDPTRFYSYRRATHAKEADYGRLISAIRL
jgi:YfiH family protein